MSRTTLRGPAARRIGLVAAAAAALPLALAVPAAAHVTVNPREAAQGGFAVLTFRVPNERDDASTTKLEVALPTDRPLALVSVKPVPGWKAVVTRATLATPVEVEGQTVREAVSRVVWTAETPASAVQPGQYQEFGLSVGPLPTDADRLVFKALQTYSSGEVVRWIEEPVEGGEEPERPAPVLTLTESGGDDHGEAADSTRSTEDSASDGAGPLEVAALVAGLAGLLLGGAALIRSFRRGRPCTGDVW